MLTTDAVFMGRALELAERGAGRTAPNPMVGAVVVRDARIVGEGFHARAGQAHAEVMALQAAGEAARGSTLYVTLEPCNHFGRTPPCTTAILQAGVQRVVAAITDPDPRVSGRGLEHLRQSGVEVTLGVLANRSAWANRFYLTARRLGRPRVLYKYAMTADGRISTACGDSWWVSASPARTEVHRLRDRLDAVLVGSGTVLHDNPQLTCRIPGGRNPLRVVADSHGRTPPSALVLGPGTLVLITAACPPARADTLRQTGAEVEGIDADEDGHCLPGAILATLHRRGCLGVLLEGGPTLAASLLAHNLVDEIACIFAPKLIGGTAPGPFTGNRGPERMEQAIPLHDLHARPLGPDIWLTAEIERSSAPCSQD